MTPAAAAIVAAVTGTLAVVLFVGLLRWLRKQDERAAVTERLERLTKGDN